MLKNGELSSSLILILVKLLFNETIEAKPNIFSSNFENLWFQQLITLRF